MNSYMNSGVPRFQMVPVSMNELGGCEAMNEVGAFAALERSTGREQVRTRRPLWAFRLGKGRDSDCRVQPGPEKPMLLISLSHEKQTAIKPRASRDSGREFI